MQLIYNSQNILHLKLIIPVKQYKFSKVKQNFIFFNDSGTL